MKNGVTRVKELTTTEPLFSLEKKREVVSLDDPGTGKSTFQIPNVNLLVDFEGSFYMLLLIRGA